MMLFAGLLSHMEAASAQQPAQASPAVAPAKPQLNLKQSVKQLPLIEVAANAPEQEVFAILVTGDGGWADLDRQLSQSLAASGIPVVGLNSLKYFWHARTPEVAAGDLENLINYYASAWNKRRVILIGYSFGADTLPFMASRLPSELLAHVQLIALLGPSRYATFEFHMSNWFGDGKSAAHKPEDQAPKDSMSVLAEVEKLSQIRFLCFYGEEETASLCASLNKAQSTSIRMSGGHHFGSEYKKMAGMIVNALE